ncbi:BQ5605_C004g02865 [Microbotryum silenes-dioicae]|uniref:BQ5605_C004g02865 protein n=1 Tax=Microbotryum silenes-dioicae TaxID=796604 RepID=A0A2X0PBC5_9BASI|nr:BQ5605_C004g02865 [Microbotryum silenes-dioicae]
MANPDSLEQYLLLLLSDSNLPTGGFIASSGLESYLQHGHSTSTNKSETIITFLQHSLHACTRLNLPFVTRSFGVVSRLRSPTVAPEVVRNEMVDNLRWLDQDFEAMTLNHVVRRASKAQGIALLTLYERAFAAPPPPPPKTSGVAAKHNSPIDAIMKGLVDELKAATKLGQMRGHFPICFGVLTAALGISLASTQHLFLFLHCRSILSSAIRLNLIGPYLSHRILLHDTRPLIDQSLEQYRRTYMVPEPTHEVGKGVGEEVRAEQDYGLGAPDDGDEVRGIVATTWPLGEILQARHDQLHSKIFNS